MPITAMPATAPVRTMTQEAYDAAMAAWIAAWPTFITETNALAAALNAIAAGTAMSIPYTFSTTTTDADPADGFLRLDNATQNTATTIRADLKGSDTSTYTDLLNTFDDSTSTIKGFIMLQKASDATKWLLFSVSALASPSGYKNITVANVASSAASPFANNDPIILKFTRNGDKGDTGLATSEAYIYVREEQAANTAGGTFTAGAWRTRTLNTEVNDAGGHASLASNQITLAAGTYRFRASAPCHKVDKHKCRLQNITAGTTLVVGTADFCGTADTIITRSFVSGRFTIAAPAAIELQGFCETTRATDGFGLSAGASVVEVYAEIELWKEA